MNNDLLSHPLANSPTIQDSLLEWLTSFSELEPIVPNITIKNFHTILPSLLAAIDCSWFTDKISNSELMILMEKWFIDK
jgi:hypothetical protein